MRGLSALAAALAAGVSSAQDIDAVLATHETAAAPLRYLRCQYTKTDDLPPPGRPKVLTGELTRGPTVLLVTAKGSGFESVFYAKPGRFEFFAAYTNPRTGKPEAKSVIAPTGKMLPDADPLRDVMVEFDVEAMLAGRGGLREFVGLHCKREAADEGAEVRIPYRESDGAIRLSKRYNLLAVGSESAKLYNGSMNRTTMTASEFVRSPQGGHLPTLGSLTVTSDGKVIMAHRTKLTKLDTTPFDEAAVRLRYPRQTTVVDQIQGTTYTVDESGNTVGEVAPFVPVVVGTVAGSTESRLPTAAEGPRAGWWLLPAGISVLSLAAAAWLFRRRAPGLRPQS